MSEFNLEAKTRTITGRHCYALRAEGQVPAVVYGAGIEAKMIAVDRQAFVKTYQGAGESSLVELKIDDQNALHVLIQDWQQDPLTDEVTHIDFRMVDMNKPIEAYVEFEFIGEAPAVKTLGGTLIQSSEGVEIRCLPNKLLRKLNVDLSKLATFEDSIRIEDLVVPEGVEILEDGETTIASVEAPRSEAEMAALNEAVEENVAAVASAVEKKAAEGDDADAAKAAK